MGDEYEMSHSQDCCESVSIESITGSLEDLVGVPIKMAEEATSRDNPADEHSYESCTWTFYKFATTKGYVDIRWLGVSNGYYSEGVDFSLVKCGDAWHVNHQTTPSKCPRCGDYSRWDP